MEQRIIKILFALLRSAISGTKLTDEERNNYLPGVLGNLLEISSKHDVVHLLVLGLKQNELISNENSDIEKCILRAVYRYERLRYEYDNLCSVLEKAKISFLPLKGSVIRRYYPEAWMRTSCDIDVLVHESDSEKAKSVLVDECGYTYHRKGSHDISFFTPTNTHIELHYDLVEDGIANESSAVLKEVWDMSTVRDGYAFWYEMPDEYYYFYHVAHMAKHFEIGGCGIRTFVDLWILDNLKSADIKKRNKLLDEWNLLKFADTVRKLSRIWFDGDNHDIITKQLEDYIISGGVYGSVENNVKVQQIKKGNKFRFVMSKIFLPAVCLERIYPSVKTHKWLLPFMQVRRWIAVAMRGISPGTKAELKVNREISSIQSDQMQIFLENIGL